SAFTPSTQAPIPYVPCSLFYVSTQSFVPHLPGLGEGRGRFDSLLRSSRRVCAFWCLIWLVRPVRQVASCFPLVSHLLQHCLWSRHTNSVPLQCGQRRDLISTFVGFFAIYGFASYIAAENPCEHTDCHSPYGSV